MPVLTIQHLSDTVLRSFAGTNVFNRGRTYFFQNRVDLISLNSDHAHCHVLGTHEYCVDLWLDDGLLGADCSCPHAEAGYFCKHMVAAGLFLRDHLRDQGSGRWREILSRAVTVAEGSHPRKVPNPYYLFFSLEKYYDTWSIRPITLSPSAFPEQIRSAVRFESADAITEFIKHNPWISEKVKSPRQYLASDSCVNCGPEVVSIANLILRTEGFSSTSYYSYSNYHRNVAEFFPLLAGTQSVLFLGTRNQPLQKGLRIVDQAGLLEIDLTNNIEGGILLSTRLEVGDLSLDLSRGELEIVSSSPLWIITNRYLVSLSDDYSSDFASIFLNAPQIEIPGSEESEFFERFLIPLANKVNFVGEEIQWEEIDLNPVKRLYLAEVEGELQAHLRFGYGEYEFPYEKSLPAMGVRRKPDSSWTLARVIRKPKVEEEIYRSTSSARYGLKFGRYPFGPETFVLRARVDPIDFLLRKIPYLLEHGFEIYGEDKLKTGRVNRNRPTITLNVSSGIDWFDIKAAVTFGDVEVSLQEIRRALRKKSSFVKLADGTIGELPEEWVRKYRHLFGMGEQIDEGVRFSNHHLTLIDQLLGEADSIGVDREYKHRLENLRNFSGIKSQNVPEGFVGELRPYQMAGFEWLHFLHDYKFGGCLADDMGLGKTVQVLAFFQSLRQNGKEKAADLVVVPKSLLVNWEREANRFTPQLRVFQYFGAGRDRDNPNFDGCDIVLTTYGTMRQDIQVLRNYKFHYVALDESQAIKNPVAQTSKAARLLNSDHRLVLTGTPVENSTYELWSQFAFLNPGLLGNLEYFKKEFAAPIERRGDEGAVDLLRKMVYPFILRRTKSQVAPELPPRTERIVYTDMEPAQRKFYNRIRDYYRGIVLGKIEEEGLNNSRMKIIEGLLRLRQISNHPKLVDHKFRGSSAKMELLIENMQTLQSEGHKALVFSQFVQMLKLVQKELDRHKIPYIYLDGSTHNRQERVDRFQSDLQTPFFLISLKAGGVGLNLTAADYVIHIDPWWNPAVEMQATDRTHRIGQDKPVFVYKLIARDSVEEKILQLQERKKNLVDQFITTDTSFFKSLTENDVSVLFS
jgi:non-specific serine/threonine protein kinase